MPLLTRTPLVPLRVLWVLLALVAGGPAADALDGRSTPVVAVLAVVAWAGWAAALVAMLVPRTVSLTVIRVLVPAGWAGSIAAAGIGDHASVADLAILLLASAALVLGLSAPVADALVDGSSYGPERRIPLRTPVALITIGIVTWAAVVAGALTGPLLLAAGAWVPGAVALLVGAVVVRFGSRSLHQLSRRWLVLVPTGLVLHDPITMPEAQLFLRQYMRRLGPARADDPADGPASSVITEDLTAGAAGLVFELLLTEPVELLVNEADRQAASRSVDRVLFLPTRPAELMDEARRNRLPVH